MRTIGFWILTVSGALLGAELLSADQATTQTNQSSGTTTKSTTTSKTTPTVKVTTLRTVGVPVGTTGTTETTTSKPLTDTPRTQPSPSATTYNRKAPKATPTPAKAKASRPIQPKTQAAPARQAEHPSESPRPTPSTTASEGIITVQGSVTTVDLKATPPTMQVALSFGPVLTLTLDPANTPVVKQDRIVKPEDVHVHDEVKIAYTPKGGSSLVKSIEVLKPAPSQGSSPAGETAATGAPNHSD